MSGEKSGTEIAFGCIGVIAVFVFTIVGGWAWESYVVMKLWNWIAPGLIGAPVITIWWSLGLCALVGAFMPYRPPTTDPEQSTGSKWWNFMAAIFLRPAFFLFLGWLVVGHLTPLR